ncbi:MAG: ATP-binding protein [Candidatus Saccharibacteria bacterium]
MAQASDPTKRYDENLIDAGVATPLVITLDVMILFTFVTGQAFTQNLLLVLITVGILVIFSLTHFIPQLLFTKRHGIYLLIYHLALASVLIFIVPTLSYFLLTWILLAYLSEFYFQLKGLFLSLCMLLATLLVGTAYQQPPLSLQTIWLVLPWFVVLTAVILVLSRIILGNREARIALAEKMIHAEYEHERIVALINSMTEAVLAVDAAGKISIYNAAALDLLDTNADLLGKDIRTILPLHDVNHNVLDIMEIASGTHYILRRTDIYLDLNDNDRLALELNISRTSLVTPLAKQQGYTFLIRDITQQQSLDEERDEFISVVSHELRTPITIAEANISMAQLISQKPDRKPEEITKAMEKAHHQVLFLSDMVNDLSTLSRAERKDKEMEVETFSAADILTELETTYRPDAEKKGLHFVVSSPTNLPLLTTSRLYLKEILQNFITNAIKYTPQGDVLVKAEILDGNKLKLSVKDSGIGISKSEQDRVYEKFWRSEDPLTRQTSGTGLGLYITAKLARRIGAQLDLVSTPKIGSTFSIILPTLAVQEVDKKSVVKNEVDTILS